MPNFNKTSKKESIKIDREEIVFYPQEKLPPDAQFKGYEELVVQDILLKPDNSFLKDLKASPTFKQVCCIEEA